MPLSTEQLILLQRYQVLLQQLEKILLVSQNEEQKKRVSKEIQKCKTKILAISPEGIPDNIHVVRPPLMTAKKGDGKSQDVAITRENILSNIVVMRISPHSNDPEINFIATLINLLEDEYAPILGDSHIKFDFSHQSERDNLLKHLENIRRTMKVLSETIEEYAQADKQDFKEQLGRMKNKQSRIFIAEAGELFRTFRDFIVKVNTTINSGTNIINNLEEPIHFNTRFERATLLEGKSIPEALRLFEEFTYAALEHINVPSKLK
ncbi:MAG: hypothetical protein N3A69_03095 [Leptospiraceae bacterium]|nr:hypothetical protein [Leptospiraceae bacterium]